MRLCTFTKSVQECFTCLQYLLGTQIWILCQTFQWAITKFGHYFWRIFFSVIIFVDFLKYWILISNNLGLQELKNKKSMSVIWSLCFCEISKNWLPAAAVEQPAQLWHRPLNTLFAALKVKRNSGKVCFGKKTYQEMDDKEKPDDCSIELQPLRQQGGSCIMKEPIAAGTLICSTLFLEGALKKLTSWTWFHYDRNVGGHFFDSPESRLYYPSPFFGGSEQKIPNMS